VIGRIDDLQADLDKITPQVAELSDQKLQLEQQMQSLTECATVYHSIESAYDHRNSVSQLEKELQRLNSAVNPYVHQHSSLSSTLQEVSYDEMNELTVLKDHQEFLLKLLTNKDSFIRKRIIDQNLAFLNHRLNEYLNTLGIAHAVKFQNDLSVEIVYMAQDMDFAQLSRGESTRVILALSWSFRDMFENMNTGINFMGIDELIDAGLDSAGVERAIELLKSMARDRNNNILLISHREELISRASNTLTVVKEDGFTKFCTDWESA
jgi:DNA repair exonuclease SbcCD ATPase subunit